MGAADSRGAIPLRFWDLRLRVFYIYIILVISNEMLKSLYFRIVL